MEAPVLRATRLLGGSNLSVTPPANEGLLSVAYVSPGWPADGLANGIVSYVSAMAEGLRHHGHRPIILAHQVNEAFPPGDVRDLRENRAMRSTAGRLRDALMYRVAPESTSARQACRSISAEARKTMTECGTQLLEMEETFGLPRLVKPRISIPVVVRIHGPWFLNGPIQGAANDSTFHRRVRSEGEAIASADGVSSPSLDVLERARSYYGLPLEDAVAIPNPTMAVSHEHRWRLEHCDPDTIIFIGRFDLLKGGDIIIDAFAKVSKQYPNVRLCFVGPDTGFSDKHGRHWKVLDYQAEHAPEALATGRIEWLGQQPRSALGELRRRAFVTVVASRYETFGLTVTEAMAHGCPLVATRAGGIPEIIQDGVNGLLCQAGDVDDLAEKVCLLLSNRSLAERLGHQAAVDCERRYHPDVIAARTVEFYRRVIAQGKNYPRHA